MTVWKVAVGVALGIVLVMVLAFAVNVISTHQQQSAQDKFAEVTEAVANS